MLLRLIVIKLLVSVCLGNNLKNEVFDKYSILNIENQHSNYAFILSSSFSAAPSVTISWKPTLNLLISTKFLAQSGNDKNIYNSINMGLIIKNNFILGMSINTLKYNKKFNNSIWNSYFLSKRMSINNFKLLTCFRYNYNQNFTVFNITNFIKRKLNDSFEIGFGLNTTYLNGIRNIPFLRIKYNL